MIRDEVISQVDLLDAVKEALERKVFRQLNLLI
jgi:hypothetical protein